MKAALELGRWPIYAGWLLVPSWETSVVLAFAEHVVTNAARRWMELDLAQKQRLQQVLFSQGLRFDGEKFGAAVTCLAFRKLQGNGEPESGMASLG